MSVKRGYFEQSADITNALILVAPLLLLYEAGLVLMNFEGLNGVDFMTVLVLRHAGLSGLIWLNVAILCGIAIAAHVRKKDRSFDPAIAPLVVVESTVYALLLGFVIVAIMQHLPFNPAAQAGSHGRSIAHAVVASLGAGVNEELFFRLGILNVVALALSGGKEEPPAFAIVTGVAVSSVIFSIAHYLGPEPFQVYSFIFRVLAGAIFAGIYLGRGLAVAVYTHAIYDVIVMTVGSGA